MSTAEAARDEDAPRTLSRNASRVWAGAVLLLAGLGLVVLGGCFVIGILLDVNSSVAAPTGAAAPPPRTWEALDYYVFVCLHVLALACFAGAALLFVVGARGLLHVLYGERERRA
jgi:hypothetical protein